MQQLSPPRARGRHGPRARHVKNRDVMIMTIASFFAKIASMIAQFAFFFGGGAGATTTCRAIVDLPDRVPGLRGLLHPDARALALPRVLRRPRRGAHHRPAQRALGGAAEDLRRRWRSAEAGPARGRGSERVLHRPGASVKGSLAGLFATHPPMEKRIDACSSSRPSSRAPLPLGLGFLDGLLGGKRKLDGPRRTGCSR